MASFMALTSIIFHYLWKVLEDYDGSLPDMHHDVPRIPAHVCLACVDEVGSWLHELQGILQFKGLVGSRYLLELRMKQSFLEDAGDGGIEGG